MGLDYRSAFLYSISTMNIPSVKTWIVTTIDGDKFEVLAPTKRLAMMNFRHDYGFGFIIETVGLKRK